MSKPYFITSNFFNKSQFIINNYENGFNALINKDKIPEPDSSNTTKEIYFINKN